MSTEKGESTHRRFRTSKPDHVDQLCDHLRDRMDTVGERVRDVKVKLDCDREATKNAIDEEVRAAREAHNRIKDDADHARARMKAQLHEQKGLTEDMIAEWKRKRQVDKLGRRAEDAEAYASWALMVAEASIHEAEFAALQAVAAHLDAERASST